MYKYSAYGLTLCSELELPFDTTSHSGTPDLFVRISEFSSEIEDCEERGSRIRLKVRGVGRFFLSHGREILIESGWSCPDDVLGAAIAGPVLATSLRQRGNVVLHASAIEIDGRAFVFMADSGMGKSTTATALVQEGARLIADDLTVIQASGSDFLEVLPGPPRVKLREDSRSLAALPVDRLKVTRESEKEYCALPGVRNDISIRIGGVFALKRSCEFRLTTMGALEVFTEVSRHAWGNKALTDLEYQNQVFDLASTFARTVPAIWWEASDDLSLLGPAVSNYVNSGVFGASIIVGASANGVLRTSATGRSRI